MNYLLLGIYLNKELGIYENFLFGKNNRRLEDFAYNQPAEKDSEAYKFIENYSIVNREYMKKKTGIVPHKICNKYSMNMELTNLYIAEFDVYCDKAVVKKLNVVNF